MDKFWIMFWVLIITGVVVYGTMAYIVYVLFSFIGKLI